MSVVVTMFYCSWNRYDFNDFKGWLGTCSLLEIYYYCRKITAVKGQTWVLLPLGTCSLTQNLLLLSENYRRKRAVMGVVTFVAIIVA